MRRRGAGDDRARWIAEQLRGGLDRAIGGALGVAVGTGAASLIRILVGVPTAVPAWAVILSMLSAGAVGLVFGIYPAYRASRLDPVEAMRRE